jgi:hypothetical protein
MDDEGWTAHLSGDAVASAIARLEAMLPAGAQLDAGRAERLRAALRRLDAMAGALAAGTLDEAALVEGCLSLLEA